MLRASLKVTSIAAFNRPARSAPSSVLASKLFVQQPDDGDGATRRSAGEETNPGLPVRAFLQAGDRGPRKFR